ncbi:DoxX family protein [Parasphingorhabdus sp.]|uniref:DoxX family protein n=1 Tax=Parasphingorhabdus sp. TaxID=2709688 RepID=UPI0030038E6D
MMRTIEAYIAPPHSLQNWADPLFRVLTSLIFIIGGLGHFGEHQMMLDRMSESPWRDTIDQIGNPSWLLWLSGGIFFFFGMTLALGWMTRLSALLLLLTLVPITITIHFAPGHVGPLFKNIAIFGALFFLYCRGPGTYAIDNRTLSLGQQLHGK